MTSPGPQPVKERVVPPDPSITSALGRHHTLATAVADLVDNSLDAGARHVLVRFLVEGARPHGLQVIDNGCGMDSGGIDGAMTYAHKRHYQGDDLGHFGIGLKAASLSQANTLLVWSKRYGSPAVGRRLRKETIDSGPVVEEFSSHDAALRLAECAAPFSLDTGTLVEWQDVQTFLTSANEAEQTAWTSQTIQALREHLGLVLHRILARGSVAITLEMYDTALEFAGPPTAVTPLDPFSSRGTGRTGYPKELQLSLGEATAAVQLHIHPHWDRSEGFLQGGRPATESQGLYIYRNDRLLQAGGWNGLATPHVELSYARMCVDISAAMERHVTINPEKSGTGFDDELRDAFVRIRAADGTSLASYREAARDTFREAKQREQTPILAPAVGTGLPHRVRDAFAENTTPNDSFPIDIRWSLLPPDQVYEIDVESHRLVLNARYRAEIVGHRSLDANDAPLVKSLLLLLTESHFAGTGVGAKKRRQDAAWQAILLAAVLEQTPQEG